MLDELKLSVGQVRWRCMPEDLGFESTKELVPEYKILGQQDAVDALKFGLAFRTHGNNVFVRGLSGFGRMSLVHQMIEESAPAASLRPDRCYLYNFETPDRPRLLSLTAGTGRDVKTAMDKFADFTEQELEKEGLTMVPIQAGQNVVPAILPLIDGKPVQYEELQQLRGQGKLSAEEYKALLEKISAFEKKFADLSQQVYAAQQQHQQGVQELMAEEANPTITNLVGKIDREFSSNSMVARSDHLMIKPGALLNADGGYLVLDAQDILSEPGAWSVLLRTLKTGMFELVPYDPFGMWIAPQLKPDPIPVDIKVVLVGDPGTHLLLDAYEPRFPHLFKVLADFSDTIERNREGSGDRGRCPVPFIPRDS